MWHLDIPKTRQYDHGKVEVLAKNSLGEAYACTQLVVKNRHDDYRALLKNSPRRKFLCFLVKYALHMLPGGNIVVLFLFLYVFRDVSGVVVCTSITYMFRTVLVVFIGCVVKQRGTTSS